MNMQAGGLLLARRSERRYAERWGMIRTDQNVEDTKYTTIHATKADNETAIHELGHNLGLLDVGAPSYSLDPKMGGFKELFYDTKNFMDYSPRTNMFWKYQWHIFYEILKQEKEISK